VNILLVQVKKQKACSEGQAKLYEWEKKIAFPSKYDKG